MPEREQESGPVGFEGVVSEDDFVAAQRLHCRAWRVWIVPLALVVAIVSVLSALTANAADAGAAALGVVLISLVALGWLAPWHWRRLYRRQPSLHEPFEGQLDEEGLTCRSPFVQGSLPWRMVVRARIDEGMILLYQGPRLFNLLPRRLFASDDDWRRAQALAARMTAATRRARR